MFAFKVFVKMEKFYHKLRTLTITPDQLQPLDISANKSDKKFYSNNFMNGTHSKLASNSKERQRWYHRT